MEIIKARHWGEKYIYIHNDLLNGARVLKLQIERRLAEEDRKGIAFNYMSCMLLLAFSVEAAINFLGHKKVSNWKERQPFYDKFQEIMRVLGLEPDTSTRPYSTVQALKEFRDMLAHGKPMECEFDEVLQGPRDEVDRAIELDHVWERFCSHDQVLAAYEDTNVLWKEWLDASGLGLFETMTRGSSTLTILHDPPTT